jgi:pimeloyl-ACP methyl ester carboxylesterase
MPQVRANGIDIEYESFGRDGDPLILLIMGFGAQLIFWPEALCQGLAAKGFRVVRFDNRDSASRPILPANQPRTLERCLPRSWPGDAHMFPTLWTIWPTTPLALWTRSASTAPISSAPRWAA